MEIRPQAPDERHSKSSDIIVEENSRPQIVFVKPGTPEISFFFDNLVMVTL